MPPGPAGVIEELSCDRCCDALFGECLAIDVGMRYDTESVTVKGTEQSNSQKRAYECVIGGVTADGTERK